jgi:hypothetical protein
MWFSLVFGVIIIFYKLVAVFIQQVSKILKLVELGWLLKEERDILGRRGEKEAR